MMSFLLDKLPVSTKTTLFVDKTEFQLPVSTKTTLFVDKTGAIAPNCTQITPQGLSGVPFCVPPLIINGIQKKTETE